jgi:hypothetical protein
LAEAEVGIGLVDSNLHRVLVHDRIIFSATAVLLLLLNEHHCEVATVDLSLNRMPIQCLCIQSDG